MGSQSLLKKESTIGSIFIFLGSLIFYVAIKYMIAMGLVTIPKSYEGWLYRILG